MEPIARSATTPWKRRAFSWRLYRYILRDFLIILACCLGAFLTVFLLFALIDDLSDFTKRDAPAPTVIMYFLYLQPDNLVRILPMSLLLATVYSITNMCRHNEMAALRAMGISIFQACLPFLSVAVLFGALQFFLAEYLAPRAGRAAKEIKRRESEGRATSRFRPFLLYRNRREKRDWLIRDFQPKGRCTELFISQFRADNSVAWELRATAAAYDAARHKWLFFNAVQTHFDRGGMHVRMPQKHAELSLDLAENPTGISFFFQLRVMDELSAWRLYQILGEPSLKLSAVTRAILWTSFFYRLFFPLSCLISVLLGVPLAVSTSRTGAMKSFIAAAGLMAAFYLTAKVFVVFGKSQILPPPIAGALPCVLFTAWGIREIIRRI